MVGGWLKSAYVHACCATSKNTLKKAYVLLYTRTLTLHVCIHYSHLFTQSMTHSINDTGGKITREAGPVKGELVYM